MFKFFVVATLSGDIQIFEVYAKSYEEAEKKVKEEYLYAKDVEAFLESEIKKI